MKKLKIKIIFFQIDFILMIAAIGLWITAEVSRSGSFFFKCINFFALMFFYSLLKCSAGAILFVTDLAKHKLSVSSRRYYLWIVPSVLMSVFFSLIFIIFKAGGVYSGGIIFSLLVFAAGQPLWLSYNIFQKNESPGVFTFLSLSIFTPVSLAVLFIAMFSIAGM
ncbi:MAG: hypothetical protein JW982_04310 [Spirochaetes bacterium]|nr:hypothetical protein [Spirochaetota bacterium]